MKAPLERNIRWAAYYITSVQRAKRGKGQKIVFTDPEGNEITAYLTNRSFRSAEMEAVGVGRLTTLKDSDTMPKTPTTRSIERTGARAVWPTF